MPVINKPVYGSVQEQKPKQKPEQKPGTASSQLTFSREQILGAKQFCDRKDLAAALLDENGTYTMKQVEEKINHYMKGKVN